MTEQTQELENANVDIMGNPYVENKCVECMRSGSEFVRKVSNSNDSYSEVVILCGYHSKDNRTQYCIRSDL